MLQPRPLAGGLALALALAAAPRAARAQTWSCSGTTCSFGGPVAMTVGKFTSLVVSPSDGLTLNGGSGTVANPTALGAGHYTTGHVDSAPLALTAYANAPWNVTVSASSPTGSTKPASDFQSAIGTTASCPAAGSYAAVTGTARVVMNGTSGTNGTTRYLCVRTFLSWTAAHDGPTVSGSTTTPRVTNLPLSFTITAP
jgi:hypothetical protein